VTLLINLLGILAAYRLGERIAGGFAGIIAALFLALNLGYLHHSHLILIDGPFAVAYIGLALALLAVRPTPGWDRHDLIAGLVAVGLAAMKWYAALMVGPIVIAYYLVACKDLPWAARLRKVLLPILVLGAFAAPYLLWKMEFLRAQGGLVSYFQRPAFYYLLTAPTFAGGAFALLVVLVGVVFLVRQPPRIRALIAATIVAVVAVMSFAPEKDRRYILPVLPFLAVLYALGIAGALDRLVREKSRRPLARGVAIGLLSLQFIPLVLDKDRNPLNTTYTGFVEAGETVRRLAVPDALILAGSVRAMRYAAGREHAERVQALPATREGLRALMARHRGRIVLETDRWEYTQPAWLFPWSDAAVESLLATGFRTEAVVRRPVEGATRPVVLVVARD
jgi:4-amino-4-deoxy-L-arabinose transferase-like glycosyltransferase